MWSRRRACHGGCVVVWWLWLALTVALAPAWAAQKVRVGVYQNSPKVALSATGKPEGIFVDLIEAVAAQEDWDIEYVPGTWAEGLERLGRGELDLMPDVARSAERELQYAFHNESVLSSWNQVYARAGSGLRTMLDLEGKRVAVLAGSVQERQFAQMAASFSLVVEWVSEPDYDAAFQAVVRGRADAVVTNRFFGVRNATRYGLEDTAIIFSPSRLFFAAPRTGHEALLAALDRHLIAFKKDAGSVYYRSLRRWAVDEVRAATPAWVTPAALTLVLLVAAAVAWVVLLRRQVRLRTQELRQRNEEARVVNETLSAIGSRRVLSAVMDEATQGALALAGLDGGVLCLRDASQGLLRVGATRHAVLPSTDYAADGGPLRDGACPAMLDVVAQGRGHALVAADDAMAHRACSNVSDPTVRWNAYFPLKVQERVIGVLCLFSR